MKRLLRIIALIACAAIVCASLCSCELLNEAKHTTAYFTDDTKKALTFNDKTYRRIETPTEVSFILNDTLEGYHAATPDIPVLLSGSYGKIMLFQKCDRNDPKVVAVLNYNTDEGYYSYSTSYADSRDYYYRDKKQYYLKEDTYDDVKKLIEEKDCSSYCTFVYSFEYSDVASAAGNILLDDAETAAVNRTLKSGRQVKWDDLGTKIDWYTIDLVSCDSTMIITDNRTVRIVSDGNDFYVYDSSTYELDVPLYQIAAEDQETFRELYKTCEDSLGYEDVASRIDTDQQPER